MFGCGGHARSVADVALAAGYSELLFVDPAARDGETLAGARVVRTFDPSFGAQAAIIGVGDNRKRVALFAEARHLGLPLPPLVAPNATIGLAATIGEGTFIGRGAHVGPFVRVGEDAIVNTHAVIDHDSQVGAHVHIAVNASITGGCRVGDFAMIGAGAVLRDGVHVCAEAIIGAGAVVVADIIEPGVYVGVPARLRPTE